MNPSIPMPRPAAFLPAAAILTAVACGGVGKQPAPGGVERAEEARLQRLAAVLRAEDRRAADRDLRAALDDAQPTVRAAAVRAYGRIGGAEAAAAARSAFEDPSPAVRLEAAFAVAVLGAPAGARVLAEAPADPAADVRITAAIALGLLGDPSSTETLSALLDDAEPLVAAAAALASRGFADPAFALDRLIERTGAQDPILRTAAAAALAGPAADPPTLDPALRPGLDVKSRDRARARLSALVEDERAGLRLWVARGLAVPTAAHEVEAIARLLGDANRQVRLAAIRSLAFPGGQFIEDFETLLELQDSHVVWMALEGLGRIGGKSAKSLLLDQIIQREDPWLRERAILSLNQADPQLAEQVANGLSREPNPIHRVAAAAALAGAGSPEALSIVERLMTDPDPRVRAAAVPAIAGLRGRVSGMLADLIEAPELVVRVAVARSAGQRLDRLDRDEGEIEDALQVLRRLWDRAAADRSPRVREQVLRSAVRLGADPRLRPLLRAGLDDPDRGVRLLASRALSTLFGEPHDESVGGIADLPLETYVKILRWTRSPRAARITVQRPGFRPGRFTIRLETDAAPLTCWRFAQRAEQGSYAGLEFTRVVPDFLAQVGYPDGDDPGETIPDELHRGSFPRGALGMASPGRDLGRGRWFVALSDQPHLVGRFTRFGHVVQNLRGVVDRLHGGDRIVSVEVYEGDGTEPLPPP